MKLGYWPFILLYLSVTRQLLIGRRLLTDGALECWNFPGQLITNTTVKEINVDNARSISILCQRVPKA